MKTIISLFVASLFASPLAAQLYQVWESPVTNGRKGVAYGYDNKRYFYLQDDLAGKIEFYDQETLQLQYTVENIEAEVFISLMPDLNQNRYDEVIIQNFRTGTLQIRDVSTGEILQRWEHPDSSYSWITYFTVNIEFHLVIEKTSKATAQSSLLYYSTRMPTGISGPEFEAVTDDFSLTQNYPNPFNPGTTITYTSSNSGRMRLSVYSIQGELIRTLADGKVPSGTHSISWDGKDELGRNVPSGSYFYLLQVDGKTLSQKMIKVK